MDDSLKSWVLQRVTERLPEEESGNAGHLVDDAQAYFLERTGRKNVPVRAGLLWADIALAIRKTKADQKEPDGHIVSIKRGDTTIEYEYEGQGPQISLNALEARIAGFRVGRLV